VHSLHAYFLRPGDTRIPILYLHATLAAGATLVQSVAKSANSFLYVVSGEADVAGKGLLANQIAILDRAGETIRIHNPIDRELSILIVAGEPIGERVMRHGPFVMNNKEEILQAVEDFRAGRMGTLD